MKVGLTGDTHGRDLYKIEKVIACDVIIVLGDFGFKGRWLTRLIELLETHDKEVFFVDGNHEAYNKLNKCEKIERFGNQVGVYANRVYHLERGRTYNIGGQKFLVFGGAESIDRAYRTIGVDWFACEQYNAAEKERLETSVDEAGFEVDYILTHDCPHAVSKMIHFYEDVSRSRMGSLLDALSSVVDYKGWFFGHHHVDRTLGKFMCLWEKTFILEI